MHDRISAPDFDTVWTKIEKQAGELSRSTAWMGSWSGKGLLLGLPAVLGVVLIFVALLSFFLGAPLFGLLCIVVGLALMIPSVMVGLRHHKAASDQHAQEVVTPMIEALAENMSATSSTGQEATLQASFDPQGGIPLGVLSRSGFIRDPKARQEDFISGTFGDTQFMLSDVKWQSSEVELSDESKARLERKKQREERANDRRLREEHGRHWRYYKDRQQRAGSLLDFVPDSIKSSVQEKYSEFEAMTEEAGPSMVMFAADFHKDFSSRTYLLPRKTEPQAIRNFTEDSAAGDGLEPMELEDPGITKRFTGWTSDQVEARYLLSPELMLAISDVADRMGSERIAVSFRGSWMYFAVVLDEDRFSFKLDTDDDGGFTVAKAIYEDLVTFLSLVEHFNLNTRIWSKA